MTTLDAALDVDPTDPVSAVRLDTAQRLGALVPVSAKRVLRSAMVPLDGLDFPCVLISAPSSSYTPISEAQPEYRAEITLEILCAVRRAEGWDTAADALAHAVCLQLFRDADWAAHWEQTPEFSRSVEMEATGHAHALATVTITGTLRQAVEFWPRDLGSLDSLHIELDFADPSQTPGEPDGVIDAELNLTAPPTA